MINMNMFGQMPGMQDQLQRIIDMTKAQQEAKKRSLIGGGVRNSGVAQFPVQSASPGLGAGGFAVAPAATAAPELAAETPSVAPESLAAAAVVPDPYNNAIRTPQQDAVGQIQGNAFMRDRSLYI